MGINIDDGGGGASRKDVPSQRKYTQGMFCGVTSTAEFANVLGVPVESIPYINPTFDRCKSKGCPFNSIFGNGSHCPCHQRSWYPLKNEKGGDLRGPEFGRTEQYHHSCDCVNKSCKKGGYFPGQDPIYIPIEMHNMVARTPNLLSSKKINAILHGGKGNNNKKKDICRLYPWHFFPNHLEKDENNKWKLLPYNKGSYHDKERNKPYDYPPPRNTVSDFLTATGYVSDPEYVPPRQRWVREDATSDMPSWMLNMLAIDGSTTASPPKKNKSMSDIRREVEMWKARTLFLLEEKKAIEEQHRQQLSGQKRKYDEIRKENEAEMLKQKEALAQLEIDKKQMEEELKKTRDMLERCREKKGQPLRYTDLCEGGILSHHVSAYTLFNTKAINDEFLDILNYVDGTEGAYPEGDGLCENLRPYSKVVWDERSGEDSYQPMDPTSNEYKEYLRRSKAARSGGRTWKDDYLTFCIYVRAGTTQEFAAGLCGISAARVSDIFHEWAQVLDDALTRWFPRPTRSQMLRRYPNKFIESDGHARSWLLLDAFEIFCEASSNVNVSSSTHSDYKGHTTVKWLGGTDPIGCPWGATVPDGNPGRASDVLVTNDTKILRQVPFGHTCKVDKGFIADNLAAGEGVILDRPQKRLKKQVQQSTVDTSQTQKVGNTRIIVENVNGELKLHIRHLNVLIPCVQFGIISKIVRIGYLLQNFKRAIIQNRDPDATTINANRPCRAEVRYHGAPDVGLRDVRDNVRLWGLKCEIARHAVLSEQHKDKSAIEISEMVLAERWDLIKRKELYERVHKRMYDGGYL